MSETIHVICREGKMEDLLEQLTAHRLDIVLSDEPASTSTRFKTFNHPLGGTGTIFCAEKKLGDQSSAAASLSPCTMPLPCSPPRTPPCVARWTSGSGITTSSPASSPSLRTSPS
jgi:hypothetical protein